MSDTITPTAPTPAPAVAPEAGGNQPAPATPAVPATQPPAPQVPTDPTAAAAYWEARHKEATTKITQDGQELARLRAGGAPAVTAPTPAPSAPALDPGQAWTRADQANWELDQQIVRIPSLTPYGDEVKGLVRGGLQMAEAQKVVAERHNIALTIPNQSEIELMPTMPGGGGAPTGPQGLSPEHEQSVKQEGIDPAVAAKHMPAVMNAWKRTK